MKKFYSSICMILFCSVLMIHTAQGQVISEIYGGGGNGGATLKHDYIELYNPTGADISLAGWSVQYNSAAGTGTWQVTNLTGTIKAKSFFLVREALGAGGTVDVIGDVDGTISMSGTAGKVALVNNTTALSGASPTGAQIIDLVGFGTANFFEGTTAASAPSNTTSIERKANATATSTTMGAAGADEFGGNGYDSNDNGADFVTRSSPEPQKTTSSVEPLPVANLTITGTLTDFGSVNNVAVSTSQNYTISSTNLNGNVTITAPTNFKVSADNVTFSTSIVFTAGVDFTLPNISKTVHVRFEPISGVNGVISGNVQNTSPGATAQNVAVSGTEAGNIGVSFTENFNTCDGNASSFSTVSETGTDVWACTTFGNASTNGVQINAGFSGGSRLNEDWLISPAITLGTNSILSFANRKDFNGAAIEVKISTNYAGASPNAAGVTWTDLTSNFTLSTNSGSSGTWTNSGNFTLSAYDGQTVYIAYKYTANGAANGGARWIIDDFQVTKTTAVTYLTVSTSDLGDLGYATSGNTTANRSFTVVGSLASNLTVTAPTNFEISKDGTTFSSSLTYIPADVTTAKTVFARFKPTTAGIGQVTGDITLTSGNITKKVNLKGTEGVNPKDGLLDIVTFNCEWFSITASGFGPSDENKQRENLKKAIIALDADIYALQEMGNQIYSPNTKGGFDLLLDELASAGYTGIRSPHPVTPSSSYGTDPDAVQKLAFIYKTSTVTKINTEVLLSTVTPNPYSTTTDKFWASGRFPYLMTADVKINGITARVKLVVLHAKSGSDADAYNRRIGDFRELKTYMDASLASDNLIVLGDYNDDADLSIYGTSQPSSYKNIVDDATNYKVLSKALSDANISSTCSFPDIVDHITVSNEMVAAYKANSIKKEDISNVVASACTSLSDHYPISAQFDVTEIPGSIGLVSALGDLDASSEVLIYPNPTEDVLQIQVGGGRLSHIQVIDNKGNVIAEIIPTTENEVTAISVAHLPVGLYTLQLTVNGEKISKRFIKQ